MHQDMLTSNIINLDTSQLQHSRTKMEKHLDLNIDPLLWDINCHDEKVLNIINFVLQIKVVFEYQINA